MTEKKSILLTLPYVGSLNLGDLIIQESILKNVKEMFPEKRKFFSSMHQKRTHTTRKAERRCGIRFLCGTNALGVYPFRRPHFHYSPYDFFSSSPYTLWGVGWMHEQVGMTYIEKYLYQRFLLSYGMHSVRDSQTEKRLNQLGITNVINTCCPTTWEISENTIDSVPHKKGRNVLLTLTDYSRSPLDIDIVKVALNHYEKVYFWPQGSRDGAYFLELISGISLSSEVGKVTLLPETLEGIDQVLLSPSVDYIGTRLHAGIRALNASKRTMLISIDNRAKSICEDIGLRYFDRTKIDELEDFIDGREALQATIPQDNIALWKESIQGLL